MRPYQVAEFGVPLAAERRQVPYPLLLRLLFQVQVHRVFAEEVVLPLLRVDNYLFVLQAKHLQDNQRRLERPRRVLALLEPLRVDHRPLHYDRRLDVGLVEPVLPSITSH